MRFVNENYFTSLTEQPRHLKLLLVSKLLCFVTANNLISLPKPKRFLIIYYQINHQNSKLVLNHPEQSDSLSKNLIEHILHLHQN